VNAHRVARGTKVRLADIDPADTGGYERTPETKALMERHLKRLRDLQARFAADKRYALLIVLQGLDASGKDGTIRHVFSGMNPQGCEVDSFKVPSPLELSHDFLWRIHQQCPPKGMIEIFNRSHYEDVLAARVEKIVPPAEWRKRYKQINNFERMLVENGTVILKFYLHVSRQEQKKRLQERLTDPAKNWKFARSDLETRGKWAAYREAYQDALEQCATRWAPWHIVPSDKKWYRNLVIAAVVLETLERLHPLFPRPTEDLTRIHIT
jgi:PPK2 family polyphosphate:nucleotide phosphotransferase